MKSYLLVSLFVVSCSYLNVVESEEIPDEIKAERLYNGPCIGKGESCMTSHHGCCSGLDCDARSWTCNSSWSLATPSWTYVGLVVTSVLVTLFRQH